MKYYVLNNTNPAYNFYKKIHPLVQFKDRTGKSFATVLEGDTVLVPHHLLLCGDAPDLFRLHASKAPTKFMLPPKKYPLCKREKIWSILETTTFDNYPKEVRDLQLKVVVGEKYRWTDKETNCYAELKIVPDGIGGFKEDLDVLLSGLRYKNTPSHPGFELRIAEPDEDYDILVSVKDVVINGWGDIFHSSIRGSHIYTYPKTADEITMVVKPQAECKVEKLFALEHLTEESKDLLESITVLENKIDNYTPGECIKAYIHGLKTTLTRYTTVQDDIKRINDTLDELYANASFSPHRETRWTILDEEKTSMYTIQILKI